MNQKCTDTKTSYYKDYGGRGLRVAAVWKNYLSFKAFSLAHGYKEGMRLTRKNKDRGFSPSNCEWVATKKPGGK